MDAINDAGQQRDKSVIEQHYIQLLELRITQLEGLLGKTKIGGITDGRPEPGATTSTRKTVHDGENGQIEAGASSGSTDGDHNAVKAKSVGEADVEDEKEKSSNGENNAAPPARVRNVVAKFNEEKMAYEDFESSKVADDVETTGSEKTPATIFRRVMDEDNPKKLIQEEIQIDSPELRHLYRKTVPISMPLLDSEAYETTPLILRSPFVEFIWYWSDFEIACKPDDDDSLGIAAAREDLKQLMAMLRKSQLEPYFKSRDASLSKGTIEYEYLWTLFPPMTKIYTKTFQEEWQMLEVHFCITPGFGDSHLNAKNPAQYTGKAFVVNCGAFDWDGSKFNAFDYCLTIKKKDFKQTEPPIDSLGFVPVAYYRNKNGERNDQDLQSRLVKRGRKFWELCDIDSDKIQCDHKGAILTKSASATTGARLLAIQRADDETKSHDSGSGDIATHTMSRSEYSGEVIVDAHAFLEASQPLFEDGPPLGDFYAWVYPEEESESRSSKKSPLTRWQARIDWPLRKQYEAFAEDPELLMMCPPRVLGYALKKKAWAQFRLDDLSSRSGESAERQQFFQKQLQLDNDYKELLLSFVKNHHSSRGPRRSNHSRGADEVPKSLDIIEGKGRGLAILLHGPPGVGKTLTAETIALHTGRPLLVVSVAEIGTRASEAERKLNMTFDMATRWRAVLLVDEADVFLEERIKSDNPNRNALVSVLLRSLEYYEGIIILTTNRVQSIDIAVQSRMHLAIQYKNLHQDQQHKIYKNLLSKVHDADIHGSREELHDLIKESLCRRRNAINGRQIRNIVSAALAVASGREDTRLLYKDLKRVYDITLDFLDSLKDRTELARKKNEAAGDD